MEALTILQCIGISAAYLTMTFVLPAILLYKKIQKLRFCERFMIYQMTGNFYMMNLVFVLELLHISNRVTLILFTVAPCIAIYLFIYKKKPVEMLYQAFDYVERLAGGQFGVRLFLRRVRQAIWRGVKRAIIAVFKRIGRNFIDILLVVALTAGLCYVYGTNLMQYFGYCESDLPVHNYWVNYLSRNRIFVAGVYPFGFHCVVYYLHTVFQIPTYVMFRVFCFVQNVIIHYVLLAFARYCCKSKFAPYIGVFMYVFLKIFGENTYVRYFSTLPQEFGMIFILPSIYFLFAFFTKKKQKKQEEDTDEAKDEKKPVLSAAGIPGINGGGLPAFAGQNLLQPDDEELPPLSEESIIRIEEDGIVKTSVGSEAEDTESLEKDPKKQEKDSKKQEKDAKKQEKAAKKRDKKIKRAQRAEKVRKIRERWKEKLIAMARTEDFWYLAGFAISFGMTLSAHFYDTMIAGLLCVGVACGYFFRLFRPKYFGKVMLTGIISIFIAVLPMLIAFLMGTPLQGSLGWGMKVISGENNKNTVQTVQQQTEDNSAGGGQNAGTGQGTVADGQQVGMTADGTTAGNNVAVVQKKPFSERVVSKLKSSVAAFWDAMKIYIITDSYPLFQKLLLGSMAFLALLSAIFFMVRQTDYAARCLSLSAGLVALSILQASSRLGLPTLMDAIRTCIFYAYVLAAAWSLCVDGVLQFFFGWFKWKWILHTFSLAALAAVVVACYQEDLIRTPPERQALQTNDAIICLTNIIHDNENFTWTICSANDELRMGEDYGYHHEVHTFLKDLKRKGRTYSITIPTSKVYFFIEKIPIMYGRAYRGDEPEISDVFADEPLPGGGGISMYQGVNRLVEMSKLYRWAQQFAELYPNDVKVYYESDNFVCYCVDQDLYRPFNFDINIKD